MARKPRPLTATMQAVLAWLPDDGDPRGQKDMRLPGIDPIRLGAILYALEQRRLIERFVDKNDGNERNTGRKYLAVWRKPMPKSNRD
jgi:hypothetical protein